MLCISKYVIGQLTLRTCHRVLAMAALTEVLVWFYDIDISAFHSCVIYGSLFLSGIYYCLRVFWCAAVRMSELELEQRTNIKFLVKLGKSGNEIRGMLVQVYGGKCYEENSSLQVGETLF